MSKLHLLTALLLCLPFITYSLNLTHGRFLDDMVMFKSIEEYNLFMSSNNLNTDINEPAYLVKCIEANKNLESACLDGTPQSFYFRPGYGDGIDKFIIYIKGGAWCSGIDEYVASACSDTCADRAKGVLGSSKSFEPYMYIPESKGDGYISNQQSSNPLAYNYNTVWINYCDGASFSGNNATNIKTAQNTTIYFRGFANLNAVFELLWNQYGLHKASDVILTGSSAGALAVYLHADYIGNNFVAKGANYMAMPDSGFFIDYAGNGNYDGCMKWIYEWQNTSIALNKDCMNDTDDYKCMFAQYTAPYIKHKILALQSRFDTYQIQQELVSNNTILINEYGNNLTKIIIDNLINNGTYRNNHYLYLDSCYHHTGQWNRITIDGYISSEVEVDVWFGNSTHRSNLWFQKEIYPCDTCCTPSFS